MKLTRIEDLRNRVKDNSHIHKYGYVCIGMPPRDYTLTHFFNIEKNDMWAESYDTGNPMKNDYTGSTTGRYYFVTDAFYSEHIANPVVAKPLTDEEKYKLAANAYFDLMGIRKGSRVRITRKAKAYDAGWNHGWIETMTEMVGKEYEVSDIICDGSVKLDNRYLWPFFVLEVVSEIPEPIRISGSYEVVFKKDASIEVGCQTIPFALLTTIYKAAEKVNSKL